MKTNKLLLFFVLIFSSATYAQSSYTISGHLIETSSESIPFANVLLLKSNDSTLVRGAVTEDDGSFVLDNIKSGNYIVMGSMVGYQSAYSQEFELNSDYEVETLTLSTGESLDEVVVEATKPLYQQKVDRMVINVENSIVSAGGSALEILERSPGVFVDRQSNSISVVGKSGVVVMINGKISYLPASAVVQLLDGMNADNIQSIELITTPPSNLDAEGNAGYINIVLKQRTDLGLNGSYSFSYGLEGSNGSTTSDNINFNYRKGKINLFGNYSYSNRSQDAIFQIGQERIIEEDVHTSSTYSDRKPVRSVHAGRLGLDYQITDKTVVGVLLNATSNRFSMDAVTDNVSAENDVPTEYVELVLDEVNHWKDFGANFNIRHNFTEKQFLNFDLIYIYFNDNNPIDYSNTYYDENQEFLFDELVRSRKLTPINRWIGNLDYSNQLNEKVKIETGIKAAFSTFDNDVSVEELINGDWIEDPTLSSNSDLVEDIYAAYGAIDYKINDKWSSKFGLRYEYTNSQLDTEAEGNVVNRQYGKFFPTFFLNRKFNDDLNMNLSYTKRITRPTFNEMAPFVIMWDPYTFTVGNIDLQPAISNSIKYDINFKSYILSLQYTHDESTISRFEITYDEINDRILLGAENMDYSNIFSATLGFPLKITNWWRTQNNLIYLNQSLRAFDSNGDTYDLSSNVFNANSISSFKISDSFSTDVTASYFGDRYAGTTKREGFFRLDIGLEQDFGTKWGKLRFTVNDVFDNFVVKGVTDIPEENLKVYRNLKFAHRTFALTYSRNFGNRKLKSSRNRAGSVEEERRRVN